MRKSIFIIWLVLAFVAGGAVVGSAAQKRGPAAHPARGLATEHLVGHQALRSLPCQDLKCVNQSLRRLTKFMNGFFRCVRLADVSSYGGYVYDDGSGGTTTTTALSETDSGDQPEYIVLTMKAADCTL